MPWIHCGQTLINLDKVEAIDYGDKQRPDYNGQPGRCTKFLISGEWVYFFDDEAYRVRTFILNNPSVLSLDCINLNEPPIDPHQIALEIGKAWKPPGLTADSVVCVYTENGGSVGNQEIITIAVRVDVPGLNDELGARTLYAMLSSNMFRDIAKATEGAHSAFDSQLQSAIKRKAEVAELTKAVPPAFTPEELGLDQLPPHLLDKACDMLGVDRPEDPESENTKRRFFL